MNTNTVACVISKDKKKSERGIETKWEKMLPCGIFQRIIEKKETSHTTTKRKEAKEGKNCIVGEKFYVARVPRFPLTWEVETVKKLLDLNGKRS